MSNFSENAGYAASASYQRFSDLGTGASIGASKMLSDIGGLMPRSAGIHNNQHIQAHHGMYSNRMTFFGDATALAGWGAPRNVSTYQHQQMAYADMGERVAGGAVFGGLHGGNALASWFVGGAAVTKGAKVGWAAGNAWGAAKLASKGLGAGAAMTAGAGAAGVAGAVAGMIPGLAAIYAGEKAVTAVVDDIKDRQQISKFLEASSWRYTPTHGADIDSKRGGFSRKARGDIAEGIKQYDYKDRSYDMKDLKGILEGGTELGMFDGTRDAKEFGDKFKKLADTLKTVTKTLHTSLAEGMKVIKSLKGAGIGASDVTGAIMQGDILGMASGKTAAEMLSYGTQGAEMVRGTGVATSAGFNMMQAGITSATLGARSGTLSAGAIEQAGGVGALAQQTMGSHMNFMNSGMGRGFMLAASGQDGKLDSAAVSNLLNGGMSLSDVASAAQGNIGNSGDYIRNVVNQGSRRRELSQKFGGRGMELMALSAHVVNARQIASDHNVDDLTAFKMSMKQSGASDSVIENSVSTFKNLDKEKAAMADANNRKSREMLGEIASRKMDWSGRIGDAVYAETIGAAGRGFNAGYNSVASWTEEKVSNLGDGFNELVTGVKLVDLKSMSKKERSMAYIDSIGNKDTFKAEASLATSQFSRKASDNFGKTKAYASINARVGGKTSSEEAIEAKNVEDYTQAVFGKEFSKLSKEEKMYMDVQVDRTGSRYLKGSLKERINDDISAIGVAQGKKIEERIGDIKAVESAMEITMKAAVASDDLSFLEEDDVEDIVEGNVKGYQNLLKKKQALAKIKATGGADYMDDDKKAAIAKATEEVSTAGDLMFKNSTGSIAEGNRAEVIKRIKDMSSGDLTAKEKKYLSLMEKHKEAKIAQKGDQLSVQQQEKFDRYSNKALESKMSEGDISDFGDLLEKMKSGDLGNSAIIGKSEGEKLLDMSKKIGTTGLTSILRKGMAFAKKVGDKEMDIGEFMDSQNLGSLSKEEKEKFKDKLGSTVSVKEAYSYFAGSSETASGTKGYGGGNDSSRGAEAQLMNELSKVQNRTADVYQLLDVLADKILAKTK